MFENVENIQYRHKLHHESHGKLESGISSRKSNPSRGQNPKRYLLRRLTLATDIHYSNDATQYNILRKCTGADKFTRSLEKINHHLYMGDIKIFTKMKKN